MFVYTVTAKAVMCSLHTQKDFEIHEDIHKDAAYIICKDM